jgi:hypothetical protein
MKKFNINTNPEKLTDAEIQQQMNFDAFVKGVKPATGTAAKTGLLKSVKFYAWAAAAVAVGVTGFFMLRTPDAPAEPMLPFINPPVAQLDIPKDSYTINTAADTVLLHSTGSVLVIPQDAFVDEQGRDVSGTVQLNYREFHDHTDIILSGIPMMYDSAGQQSLFESAGMFEIGATQNGKPLKLKPGREIKVNMISTNSDSTFNYYTLDTTARRWIQVESLTQKDRTPAPVFVSATVRTPDAPAEPVMPNLRDNNAHHFTIDYLPAEFPELAPYKNLEFEVLPGEAKYKPELAATTWDDVFLQPTLSPMEYTITFSKADISHSFRVKPVVAATNFAAAKRIFETKMQLYNSARVQKKNKEQATEDSLNLADARLSGIAKRSDLNSRLKGIINNTWDESNRDQLVYRSIAVRSLGVGNWDKPINRLLRKLFNWFGGAATIPAAELFKARFKDKAGKVIAMQTIYVANKEMVTAYPMHASKFDEFHYEAGIIDLLVGVTDDNTVYYLKNEKLHAVQPANGEVVFVLEKVDASVNTPAAMKAILNIR